MQANLRNQNLTYGISKTVALNHRAFFWKGTLTQMVFTSTFRVRWVDTDNAGVMHFSNYLRYFEACEEEFYRSLGMTWNKIRERYKITLPRVEAHCQYKSACRFDDLIEITMKVREIASKTITYDFQLSRKHDGRLAAEGYIKCIAVDSNWKAVALPVELAKTISESAA